MTPEQEIAALRGDASRQVENWRANVGRFPRAFEPRLADLVRRFGASRVDRAIASVADLRLRRTADRWGYFLALFGEAP
jgi:hypothetical protein